MLTNGRSGRPSQAFDDVVRFASGSVKRTDGAYASLLRLTPFGRFSAPSSSERNGR